MKKCLARLEELSDPRYVEFMQDLNHLAHRGGLQEYTTYCRIWEYPWLWFQLEPLKRRNVCVLDVGSERSPFPWYLATHGFQVLVSDTGPEYWDLWKAASRKLEVRVGKRILDAQDLDLPTASVDAYLSVSVLEHIPDKARAISEAGRVLKCGGLLMMTFDICEPDRGMSFPDWNGRAVSMREFDELFAGSPWFEPGLPGIPWNTEVITKYLAWHRTTAPHHNYVTGAAVVRRSTRAWSEPFGAEIRRTFQAFSRSDCRVGLWRLKNGLCRVRQRVPKPVRAVVRKGLGALRSGE